MLRLSYLQSENSSRPFLLSLVESIEWAQLSKAFLWKMKGSDADSDDIEKWCG